MLQSAPQSIDRQEVSRDDITKTVQDNVCLQVDLGKDALADLIIETNSNYIESIVLSNTGDIDEHINGMFFRKAADEENQLALDKNNIQESAKALLSSLGADNMAISQIDYGFISSGDGAGKACYKVSVDGCFNSFYVPYIASNESTVGSEEFSKSLPPEYMTIYIDDSGIIGFIWSSPMEVIETLNDNVAMLPIDNIKDCFVQQFINKYSFETSDRIKHVKYNITEITLNLARIKVPDEPNKYMLVPVWDFFGERVLTYSDKKLEQVKENIEKAQADGSYTIGSETGDKNITINESDEVVETFVNTTYLTINGITGTSINRNLGY